jgi:hypothetical protein
VTQRILIGFLLLGVATAGSALAQVRNDVTLPIMPKTPTLADAVPDEHGVHRMAILRGLDKVTGRATDVAAPVDVPVSFGTLSITVRYCYTVPPEEPPETAAFLQIDDTKGERKRMFSGWMFASTPALNGLEHAVYDVWVITCKTDQPVEPEAADPLAPAAPAGATEPVAPPAAPSLSR